VFYGYNFVSVFAQNPGQKPAKQLVFFLDITPFLYGEVLAFPPAPCYELRFSSVRGTIYQNLGFERCLLAASNFQMSFDYWGCNNV